MSVLATGGLQPSDYWQNVCALANDLLTESPLRDWTVIVREGPDAGQVPDSGLLDWNCQINRDTKEIAVSVPGETHDPDETDPEDVATYIVFDLLHEKVGGDGRDDAGLVLLTRALPPPWRPPAALAVVIAGMVLWWAMERPDSPPMAKAHLRRTKPGRARTGTRRARTGRARRTGPNTVTNGVT